MKRRGQSAHLNLTRGRAFPPCMYETPQPDPVLHSHLLHDQISQEHTHELLTRLCKREDSCGNGSAVLLHFRESIKFLIPLNTMTWLVKKQAFFLKCSQHPNFLLNLNFSLIFLFLTILWWSLSLEEDCRPLKTSYQHFPEMK